MKNKKTFLLICRFYPWGSRKIYQEARPDTDWIMPAEFGDKGDGKNGRRIEKKEGPRERRAEGRGEKDDPKAEMGAAIGRNMAQLDGIDTERSWKGRTEIPENKNPLDSSYNEKRFSFKSPVALIDPQTGSTFEIALAGDRFRLTDSQFRFLGPFNKAAERPVVVNMNGKLYTPVKIQKTGGRVVEAYAPVSAVLGATAEMEADQQERAWMRKQLVFDARAPMDTYKGTPLTLTQSAILLSHKDGSRVREFPADTHFRIMPQPVRVPGTDDFRQAVYNFNGQLCTAVEIGIVSKSGKGGDKTTIIRGYMDIRSVQSARKVG